MAILRGTNRLEDDYLQAQITDPGYYTNTGGNLPPLVQTMTTGGNQPPSVQTMNTGGNLPPLEQVVMNTGGNTPPSVQTMNTGGNLPPLLQQVTTGGNLPPLQAPTMNTGGNLPPLSIDGSRYVANLQQGQAPGPQFSPTNVVQGSLDQLLNPNNAYVANARRRGAEVANRRGLLNSSLAAGTGERAAMESVTPLLNQALDLHRQRESLAFQGQENALNRVQSVNRDMLGAELNDWMSSRQFTREFNGALSMLPIKNSMDLTNAVSQYAMENPELYTPEIVSGMSNFFNRNSLSILQTYFPSMLNTGGNG